MHRHRPILVIFLVLMGGCTPDTPATGDRTKDATSDANVADVARDTAAAPDAMDARGDANRDVARRDATDSTEDTREDVEPPDTTLGNDQRPAEIVLPDAYDPTGSYPLVIALHGYGMSGASIDTYFELSERVDERQFLLISPDGMRDTTGQRFWNATDYCCDHYGAEPDDDAYVMGLIDEATNQFAVDAERIYLMGFSNGGFLAHRLACEHPDRIAGIVSLSGSSFDDAEACSATDGGPRILHVHGTADAVVGYYGTLAYPGARTVAERWARRNGCQDDATDRGRADFDLNVVGDETWQREWEGCRDDSRVALWSLQGGLHVPTLRDAFVTSALDFLSN